MLGGEFMFLFKTIDIHLKYLISLVILDFFTGLFKAYLKKKTNRSISAKGIFKKISYFVVIWVSVIIDHTLNMKEVLRNIVIYSFLLSEMISILKNCTEMGIRLPKILISSLEIFQKKMNHSTEEKIKKKK